MALLSGKTGFVLDTTGTSRSFNEWDLDIAIGRPNVTNWNTVPFQALVLGNYKGKVTVSGPYDYGNMPFTAGLNSLSLGLLPGVFLVVTAIFDLKISNKTDGNPNVSLTGDTTGPFTIAII